MSKILSTAQKTFVDLYDSYTLTLTPEVAVIPCDESGNILAETNFVFNYSVSVGGKSVNAQCAIDKKPTNFSTNTNTENTINVTVPATSGTMSGKDTDVMEITITTTDTAQFTFKRYITFIKVNNGTNGQNGMAFKIYSEQGSSFTEGIDQITMKTILSNGANAIISGVTYQWSCYDALSTGTKWQEVSTSSSLSISKQAAQAQSIFKCVATYNNAQYTDYYTLHYSSHNYNLLVKFFNGTNMFNTGEPFIIAYLELYKDGKLEEGISSKYYYYNNSYIQAGSEAYIIGDVSSLDPSYSPVYIIFKNQMSSLAKYQARLCKYNSTSQQWEVDNSTETQYAYTNDLYPNSALNYSQYSSNIVVISKEEILQNKNVSFCALTKVLNNGVSQYDQDLELAHATTTVIDLNDPIVSATQPNNPKDGQLWLNTSKLPYELKIYENGQWVYFIQQNGQTIYTSRPSTYAEGDLWILGPGESCDGLSEGSIMRALNSRSNGFFAADWRDAMTEITQLKTNIEQYMKFDPTTGLRIGQNDEKFYVNIDSNEMGFFDNTNGAAKKVVYISNQSANIDGLTVETSFDVNCSASFSEQVKIGNYLWKQDTNGGLSLSISK